LGYDRPISYDVVEPDGTRYVAYNAKILHNDVIKSTNGSLIRGSDGTGGGGYLHIEGNYGEETNSGNFIVGAAAGYDTIIITDNEAPLVASDLNGISLYGDTDTTAVVTENIVRNATNDGIYIDAQNRNFTVSDNTVIGCGRNGIQCRGANGKIGGNIVDNASNKGILTTGGALTVTDNFVYRSGENGIRVESSGNDNKVTGNLVGLSDRNSNSTTDLTHEYYIDDTDCTVTDNTVFNRGNGYDFVEGPNADDNVFVANEPQRPYKAWDLKGPETTVGTNGEAFDVHRSLSPSSGSVSVTFEKPYASKPILDVTTESVAMYGVSWSTDADGNYTGATVSFEDASGAVNPTTHIAVKAEQ